MPLCRMQNANECRRSSSRHDVLLRPAFSFIIQLIDILDEIRWFRSTLTISEFASVYYASFFPIQPHSTARLDVEVGASFYALPQHAHSVSPIVFAHAVVEFAKVNSVLQRAFRYQFPARDFFISIRQAHCKSKIDLRVRILGRCAELKDVAQAFGLTVHALHAVVFVGSRSDIGEFEVYFV